MTYDIAVKSARAISDIIMERYAQNKKWGVQRHSWAYWNAILGEEVGEVAKEVVEMGTAAADLTLLRAELVQLAAVAVAIIEHIDEVHG